MSKITFSKEYIRKLKENPNVAKVSKCCITYSDEFKRFFIEEYLKGKLPRLIFQEAGFDVDMIGKKRYEQSACRWIKAYREDGVLGLRDTRKESTGRPRIKELSQEEIIKRQEAKIKLLEEQVEMLKKLDIIERRLVKEGRILPASRVFQLIYDTIWKYNLNRIVSYFCEMLEVSRSGYYNYVSSSKTRRVREKDDLRSRDAILKIYNERGYKKGSRSIKMVLEQDHNMVFNRKKIQRIMRKYDIICPIRKANPYKRIAKATKEHSIVPNLLNR
jgi:transposase